MHEDRPSNKQIIWVAVGIASGIALVIVVGGMLLGSLIAAPAGSGSDAPTFTAQETTEPASEVETQVAPEPTQTPAPVPTPPPAPPAAPVAKGVVCIDAGHQLKGDSSQEPVGPGASERKPKVAGGASGTATGNPESLINLQVSLKLRDELVKRGVTVVMVRTEQDVNISNSERAAIANDAQSDLFVRIHCDGAGDSGLKGLSTLVPAQNQWTGPIVAPSRTAAGYVHKAVIASTGANDRGVVARGDLSGFNWATVPTVLVEMGFMSNPDEDRRLATSEYQQKLAVGMADGIVEYLASK